jgi:Flp pilus assembly protein TadB
MRWKRDVKKAFIGIGSSIEDAGKYVGYVTAKSAKSAGHTVEHAVDRVTDQARMAVEDKVERAVEQVQDRISKEVAKATPGIMLLGIGMTIAAISVLLFSLVVVQVLTNIAHLPLWAAYLVVSIVLAIISFVLVQQGQSRLSSDD